MFKTLHTNDGEEIKINLDNIIYISDISDGDAATNERCATILRAVNDQKFFVIESISEIL